MRDYFLMKRIKKRETRIKLLFWICFIVIGFIFVFGFDFSLKSIGIFAFFVSIPVILYFCEVRAIEKTGNNFSLSDKTKLNDELSEELVSDVRYSLTNNYIVDYYDNAILKYNDVLLIYWTTISTGKKSHAKAIGVVTRNGEYNLVSSNIGTNQTLIDAYTLIKEKNSKILEGLSKSNIKTLEFILKE